jgi:mRNA interferase MazF
LLTSQELPVMALRPQVEPSVSNGLIVPSRLMIDKLMTVRRDKIGKHIGRLSATDMDALDRAIALYLGLAI